MNNFGQKPQTIPFKKSQIIDFFNFLFLYPRKAFFRSRILLNTFSWPRMPNKKKWKNGQFWTKTMDQPLWKNLSFFDILTFLFLKPRKAFFRSRILLNTFSWPRMPNKKKVEKWPIFGQKRWTNPFGKVSIFSLFQVFVFIAQNTVFQLGNIIKNIFLAQIVFKKKRFKKMNNFGQKPQTIPLEKSQIFDFCNFLFLQPRKTFFRSRI